MPHWNYSADIDNDHSRPVEKAAVKLGDPLDVTVRGLDHSSGTSRRIIGITCRTEHDHVYTIRVWDYSLGASPVLLWKRTFDNAEPVEVTSNDSPR